MLHSLNNFQQRFLLGFIGILLITAIIFFSHTTPFNYLFIASVGCVQAIALWEYYQLAKEKNITAQSTLGITFSLIYIVMQSMKIPYSLPLFLFAFMVIAFIKNFKMHQDAIASIATTLFGFVYITLPLSFLIDLNFAKIDSSIWIIYLIVVTKITDTSAYIAGKTCGKHFFAPVLSPKKTWEGAIAGLLGAGITSTLILQSLSSSFSLLESALLGLTIGFFAQIGDLAESLLKRDANVKDSNKLPGFGGFLDIVDSLIFTTPLLFFWLKFKDLV